MMQPSTKFSSRPTYAPITAVPLALATPVNKKITTYAPGRRCACGTVLSIYNPGTVCVLCIKRGVMR